MPERFDDLSSYLAGEPLLGPRQAALVDALTQRLGGGCRMNEHDLCAAQAVARLLGLTAETHQPRRSLQATTAESELTAPYDAGERQS